MEIEISKPSISKAATYLSANCYNFCDGGAPCMLGIDEAGRGPVLGPMIYAGAIAPLHSETVLKDLGVDDSKALTEAKREEIFESMQNQSSAKFRFFNSFQSILNAIAYLYQVISARMISGAMLRRCKYSLNELSHASAIELIELAYKNCPNITTVYIDTVGPKASYQSKVQQRFPNLTIHVSEKADSKYPIVGAASIVAKVNRDRLLREWKFDERDSVRVPEEGYGTGYPGDPNTKKFLADSLDPVFGFSSLVRFSWKTADFLLEKRAYQCKWPDPSTAGVTSWFKVGKKSDEPQPTRHIFFVDRNLSNMADF